MNHVGGSAGAASLAQKILLFLHKDQVRGMADLAFPAPEGYECIEICAYTGKRATNRCEQTYMEWFPSNRIPELDDTHLTIGIDCRNGLLATPWTPKDEVVSRTFLNLPPQYADWSKNKGISSPPSQYSPLNVPTGASLPLPVFTYATDSLKPVSIKIHSPENGIRILHNPEVPKGMNTLALNAFIHPSVPQALWCVDGKPFKLAEAPYSARWPLEPGMHSFQVKLPYRHESSEIIMITVE
jgi:penicillin-binding protein 1C